MMLQETPLFIRGINFLIFISLFICVQILLVCYQGTVKTLRTVKFFSTKQITESTEHQETDDESSNKKHLEKLPLEHLHIKTFEKSKNDNLRLITSCYKPTNSQERTCIEGPKLRSESLECEHDPDKLPPRKKEIQVCSMFQNFPQF